MERVLDRANKIGRLLASPEPGEEVVISGAAGRFPDSDDFNCFRDNLYNNVDLITDDARRWEKFHDEIPQRTGKINNINKHDAGFFGVHYRQVQMMEPMCRMLLEHAVEAIFDAGFHPKELEGTRTGVFVGMSFTESENDWFFKKLVPKSLAITGFLRSMFANHISYHLKLQGPSLVVDTACSSSLYALEHAWRAIRNGQCDSALVCGSNLCLNPYISLQFSRLGVLSPDGRCKSFDEAADGYSRSETISVVYLQKAKDCRRLYSKIVYAKINCDGYKEEGITFPSKYLQKKLLDEFYFECNVDPCSLTYVEAHGTGTRVGDMVEVNCIDDFFCAGRTKPLLIGTIKSNLGHSEPASGMCSVAKTIIAMENGYIPANLNYKNPRKDCKGLLEGRLKVIVEKTPWPDSNVLVALSNFGFGGSNVHVLLQRNQKLKKHSVVVPSDGLPRLVCASGRNPEAVDAIFDYLTHKQIDLELVRLYHEIFKYDVPQHLNRGFVVLTKKGEAMRSCVDYSGKRPLCFVFTELDSVGKTNEISKIPLFNECLQNITSAFSKLGVNGGIVGEVLKGVSMQLASVDFLRALDVKIDTSIGRSFGIFAAAYCDGSLSLQQAIRCAYCAAEHIDGGVSNNGIVAEVDVPVKKLNSCLPEGVEIVSEPSNESVVICGDTCAMKGFLEELTKRGVSFRKTSNHHSVQFPKKLAVGDHRKLQELMLEHTGDANLSEFLTKNLTNATNTKTLLGQISGDATIVKFGYVNTAGHFSDSVDFMGTSPFEVLGKLYESGQNPRLERLYPEIQYPVSCGTPMISPSIKWEHSKDWFTFCHKTLETTKNTEKIVKVCLRDPEWEYLAGHVIDGRNLFPATGYLYLVCHYISLNIGTITFDFRVLFEDVKFMRATTVNRDSMLELLVSVQDTTGYFEITEGNGVVVSGRVTLIPGDTYDEDLNLPALEHGDKSILMSRKDIYKELRLRGYNYSGLFQSINECDVSATCGTISWMDNWVAFMDNMLQMQILQVDTRNLYVPTGIKRLMFDGKKHMALLQQLGDEPKLPVYVYRDAQIIKSGAIEIRGLTAAPITKRKPTGEPVLEKYQFVPNVAKMTVNDSVRTNIQIILENLNEIKFKAVEVFDDDKKTNAGALGPVIFDVLADQPLIQPDITVLSKKKLDMHNVTVEDKNLSEVTDCLLVVVSHISVETSNINKALCALKPNGFILSRENLDYDESKPLGDSIEVMTVHVLQNEKLVMLRKTTPNRNETAVDVGTNNFEWLQPLQIALKSGGPVVVYAQNQEMSGLIGFYNCLKREPGGDKARCVFICGEAPPFDLNLDFYQRQLKKSFSVNVYKDGQWGTYRHLLLERPPLVEREHCYVNVTVRGDLSSLKWIEGPLTYRSLIEPEKTLVNVYYSALNFRDIMTASGRISGDVITRDRTEQDCLQGIEFSGRDQNGRRVMGMVNSNALSTLLAADSHMLFDVPDEWSLEEAATIPVVYGTVLYALFTRGKLKHGQSILIHAGSGGVGQAAINVALSYGCTVFTTVGTEEKRNFIKKHFPQLTDRNIGNSRDTSFEELVMTETKGRGVDFVLNSLAEEKLQASLRCLAKGGAFLEIGKFDLAANNLIELQLFEKGASFHGVMLDSLFKAEPNDKMLIKRQLMDGIGRGFVKPLIRTVFEKNEIEEAFRFMAGGKHIGKVLIRIREEECLKTIERPPVFTMEGIPRYYCDKDYSYVITGGLGGFGLELADWLVLRGCRKLVLTSRSGIKNGYQNLRVRTWSSYGVTVKISTADITTKEGCRLLLREAIELGPVHAIFNLAVVLKDAAFENQTVETFTESFGPKVCATKHLDEASRILCPQLRDFVVFSSVSCGRGNPGQTNYGMANSIMERICERRKKDGLPGLAVEWGAVGEVGLVADMQKDHVELTIGGTLQQKISSCLEVLDVFLKQDEPVVSSMVVAVKRSTYNTDSIVDCVAHIVGLKDLKTVSLHSTLPELGMDSIMAVEIKQTLERDFEVFLTPEDMRGLTFARLHDIQASLETRKDGAREKLEVIPQGLALLLRYMGSEETAHHPIIRMESMVDDGNESSPTIFVVAGVEGNYKAFEKFSPAIKAHVLCLQLSLKNHKNTAHEMAMDLFKQIKSRHHKSKPYILVAYSFGCLISLELVALLEQNGYNGDVIFVDGAPKMLLGLIEQQLNVNDKAEFETGIICGIMSMFMPLENILKIRDSIYQCNSFEDRIEILANSRPEDMPFTVEYTKDLAIAFVKRLQIVVNFTPTFTKLNTTVRLFRPTYQSITNLPEDYDLSQYTQSEVKVQFFEGNHLTVLEHADLIDEINKTIVAAQARECLPGKDTFLNGSALNSFTELNVVKQI